MVMRYRFANWLAAFTWRHCPIGTRNEDLDLARRHFDGHFDVLISGHINAAQMIYQATKI
jgi:hypothetical protein